MSEFEDSGRVKVWRDGSWLRLDDYMLEYNCEIKEVQYLLAYQSHQTIAAPWKQLYLRKDG